MTADILSAKGTFDDSAAAIILQKYREHDEEKHKTLIEALNHLNKPQREDFRVVSIGVLCLVSQTKASTSKTKQTGAAKKKSDDKTQKDGAQQNGAQQNPLLANIDFTKPETFTQIFEIYDQLVADYLNLEEENRNSEAIVLLLQNSALYGDETIRKRLVGALVYVKDWPGLIKRWASKTGECWDGLTTFLDGLMPTGERILGASQGFRERARNYRHGDDSPDADEEEPAETTEVPLTFELASEEGSELPQADPTDQSVEATSSRKWGKPSKLALVTAIIVIASVITLAIIF